MGNLWQDLRYAARMLAKSPGFTAVAVLTLALGIGANTAIFSAVNATLFRPLPYKNPGQIVLLGETEPSGCCWHGMTGFSTNNFLDLREQNGVFQNVATFNGANFTLTGVDRPQSVNAGSVTADFFHVLEVQPMLGRGFLPEEEQAGHDHVVVLSNTLWRRSFASNPNIVGQTVHLDTNPYTVVGVLAAGFTFSIPGRYHLRDLWVPAVVTRDNDNERGHRFLQVIARLKPGVTSARAQADLDTISARLVKEYPKELTGIGMKASPLQKEVVGDVHPLLLILFGAVGLVLLIACANVANLQLARASAREKEIAVRAALGASRGRVVRQLLTESVLLALAGGVLGTILASWGTRLLMGLRAAGLPAGTDISIDSAALFYTLGLSLFTGMLFGLAPALRLSPTQRAESLKEAGRTSTAGESGVSLRNLLTVSEVALAMILLIGAGLLLRTFAKLLAVDPGFETKNILTVAVDLPHFSYPDPAKQVAFYAQILERIKALPGVKAAGATSDLPLTANEDTDGLSVEGHTPPKESEDSSAETRLATPNLFRAMGIPLMAGRPFTDEDTDSAAPVAIVNQSFVRRFFLNEDPVGRRVKFGNLESQSQWITIVGVVGDVHNLGLDKESKVQIYVPCAQHSSLPYNALPYLVLVIRSDGNLNALAAAVSEEINILDKNMPIPRMEPMEAVYAESLSARRFNMFLLGAFAGIAILLAGIGIYGVIMYSVVRRTHEIGIRMALGAQQRDIWNLIIWKGTKLALIGIAIGVCGALALTRVLSNLLYGVKPTDPMTFVGVAFLLFGLAFLACYIPARRATKVDPMVALRYE